MDDFESKYEPVPPVPLRAVGEEAPTTMDSFLEEEETAQRINRTRIHNPKIRTKIIICYVCVSKKNETGGEGLLLVCLLQYNDFFLLIG